MDGSRDDAILLTPMQIMSLLNYAGCSTVKDVTFKLNNFCMHGPNSLVKLESLSNCLTFSMSKSVKYCYTIT